jgi:hypothetical protein
MYRVWGRRVPIASQLFDITPNRINFVIQDHDVVKVKIKSQNSLVIHTFNDSSSNDVVVEFQSMTPIFGDYVIELPLMMPISKDDPFVSTKLKILTPAHELNLQCTNQVLRTHHNIINILRSFGKFYQCKSELCTLDYDTIDIYKA